MNKSYRVIWNESTQTWQAVAEIAMARGKKGKSSVIASGSIESVKKALALTLLATAGIAGAASVDGTNVGNAGYGDTYNAKSDLVIGVNGETVADKKANSNGRNTIIGNEAKIVNTVGKVDSAVAIGAGAEAGQKSVAIGGTWTGEGATQATAYKSVALGYDASATTPGSGLSVGTMALGAHATAIGSNNNSASSMDSAATAIGYYSYANGGQSLALGARTRADALQSTAIGNDSLTTGRGAVAIGGDDSGKKDGSDGGYSNAQFTYTGYQKLEDKGTAGNVDINGVQIEAFRPTYAADAASTAISPHAQALTQGSTAIGVGATAGKGVQTKVKDKGDYYEKSTFTPDTDAIETTAVGAMSTALEKRSTALGYYSAALGVSATSVGDRANARGENSTAIGALSLAQANDSGAIGATNYVGALNNSDTKNTAGAENSWAIGNYNNVTSPNTFVIGNYVNAKLDAEGKPIAIKDANGFITGYESLTTDGTAYNSVYLGDRSIMAHGSESPDVSAKALKANGSEGDATTGGAYGEVTKAEIRGRKLNPTTNVWESDGDVIVKYEGAFQGNDSVGGVSVGSAGAERRIMNVAAGQIAPTSTDAINGSQLYAIASNPIKFTANSNKDTGANGDADLTKEDGLGRVLGQSIAVIGSTTNKTLDINEDDATAGTYSAKNLQTVVDDEKIQIQMAENPTFESVQLGDENGPVIGADGDNIKVGDKDGNPTNITNVKGHLADAGDATEMPADSAPDKWTENKNDAATLGDVLNAGWNLQGNGNAVDFVTHGDTVNFVDGNLTKVSVENKDGVNNVKVDVNLKGGKDIEITDDGVINYTGTDNDTITTLTANNGEKANETKGNITLTQKGDNYDVSLNKDITLDKGSITIAGDENTVSIAGDNVDMGGNQIHNVAAGTEPNDAVNVSQLKDIVGDVARNEVKKGDTIGGTTIDGDYNIVTSKDDPQATLKTYNVHTQTEFVTNDVVQAISKMNEQGIKFFHTNDGTQEPEAQARNTVDASAKGKFSTAIGYQAKADGDNALAIGNGSKAIANNSIAIGTGNEVKAQNSGAIGDPNIIEMGADNSYVIGNNNTVNKGKDRVFVLGNNVTATEANSVYLGDSSSANTKGAGATGTVSSATVGDITYSGFAGETSVGMVSVGNESEVRRVSGVAAGEISATSTDAINGSQLYSVAQQVSKAGPVQYSNANSPTTPNGGVPSNDVTIVGADQNAPVTVHNVAPGVADTDAVNVSQLKQAMGNNKNWEPRINQVENRANAGVAQAMATAGLPQAYLPGKSMFAAGTGVYRGEVGYAVGVSSISDGGNWIVKGTASGNSRGNFGATAAIGYQW